MATALLDALARRRFFRAADGMPVLVTRLDGREYVVLDEAEAARWPRMWKAAIVGWILLLHALLAGGLAGSWVAAALFLVVSWAAPWAPSIAIRGKRRHRTETSPAYRVRGRLRGAVGRAGITAYVIVLAGLAIAAMVALGLYKGPSPQASPQVVTLIAAFMLYAGGVVSLSLDLPGAGAAAARTESRNNQ